MYLIKVLERNEERDLVVMNILKTCEKHNISEIVYYAEEFINDKFLTTNICYRIKIKTGEVFKGKPVEKDETLLKKFNYIIFNKN